jgi:hypothetical protein
MQMPPQQQQLQHKQQQRTLLVARLLLAACLRFSIHLRPAALQQIKQQPPLWMHGTASYQHLLAALLVSGNMQQFDYSLHVT